MLITPRSTWQERASAWILPARTADLRFAALFVDLHELPKVKVLTEKGPSQIQLEFLRVRNEIISMLLTSSCNLPEVNDFADKGPFRRFIVVRNNWNAVVDVIAAQFAFGNFYTDNKPEDAWIGNGVFAINFWKE